MVLAGIDGGGPSGGEPGRRGGRSWGRVPRLLRDLQHSRSNRADPGDHFGTTSSPGFPGSVIKSRSQVRTVPSSLSEKSNTSAIRSTWPLTVPSMRGELLGLGLGILQPRSPPVGLGGMRREGRPQNYRQPVDATRGHPTVAMSRARGSSGQEVRNPGVSMIPDLMPESSTTGGRLSAGCVAAHLPRRVNECLGTGSLS